jgi:YHS domain-containing protein
MMRILFLLLPLLLAGVACATLENRTFSTDDGAIRGYDPVAYFSERRPVKGQPEFTHQYAGATWYFANQTNRDLFADDPESYVPQYGGYCAYAMSKGYIASTDPEAWTIHDNKLYLNYSLSVRESWLEDVPGNVRKADGHWAEKLKSGIDG